MPPLAATIRRTSILPLPQTGRLIVIEPDESVREALGAMLRSAGWSVAAEPNGSQLEAHLDGGGVAAVLCEARLPDRPAESVLSACRSHAVPVVFTGSDLPAQRAVDLVRSGAADFLAKPFSPARLKDLLCGLRNRQNGRTTAAVAQSNSQHSLSGGDK